MHVLKSRVVGVLVVGLALLSIPLQPASLLPPLYAQTADVSSVRDGYWADTSTWSNRRVPQRGERVVISPGHEVTYDVSSDVEIGRLLIRGTLVFARSRSTRLDVAGNVIVDSGGYLEMGTRADPMPRAVDAEIRFAIPSTASCTGGASFVERDTGLWVMGGGRWEAHGAPVRVTWTKLADNASAGVSTVRVVDDVTDWEPGSMLVVTPTDVGRRSREVVPTYPQYEEVELVRATRRTGYTELQLSRSLRYTHSGTAGAAAEVALLSRNVIVTSKYPDDRVQGHTMFMHDAEGGLSYAEFRQLGDMGCVSRYPVHFHMMEESSRGMRIQGLSIWRSNSHLLNIHASHGITVEDTVGYHATGIGFMIEKQSRMFSVDNVFVNNLAARIVYRDGSLDGRHLATGFWISSTNTMLIGNVASGSWGLSNQDSGFHIGSAQEITPGYALMKMVSNESHSNNASGLHTWNNGGPEYLVLDFRAWRNGFAGIKWGAYRNKMRVHRAELFENRVQNFQTTAIEIVLADSQLYGTQAYPTPTGMYIDRYFIANDPVEPSQVLRNTFSGHAVHVSHIHDRCGSSREELDPESRECSATYLLLRDNRFNGGTAFDFGWHRNANSYFEIGGWNGTASPSISASNFRLTRRDRSRPASDASFYAPYDAWLDPLPSVRGSLPPLALLTGLTDDAVLGSSVVFVPTITAAAGVQRVTYYVDEREVGSQTAGPFRFTWSASGWTRRYAHVYAAVTDRNGNTAYTQVVRLRR